VSLPPIFYFLPVINLSLVVNLCSGKENFLIGRDYGTRKEREEESFHRLSLWGDPFRAGEHGEANQIVISLLLFMSSCLASIWEMLMLAAFRLDFWLLILAILLLISFMLRRFEPSRQAGTFHLLPFSLPFIFSSSGRVSFRSVCHSHVRDAGGGGKKSGVPLSRKKTDGSGLTNDDLSIISNISNSCPLFFMF